MTERLTTLQAVKSWLDIDNTTSDDLLVRIIDAASQFALNYMNRDSLMSQSYTQTFKGNGKTSQLLRNWPIVSVTSVGIDGSLIPEATIGQAGLPSNGFVLSDPRNAPSSVDLYGYYFLRDTFCQVIYSAGFETSQLFTLTKTDPGDTYITVSPTNTGQWSSNLSVLINSLPATQVTQDPTAGQYSVDEWGSYTFSGDDEGYSALIAYSYVPWDVSFGVTEIVGEWFKRQDRIGIQTKTLGGQETIVFSLKDMNDSVRSLIQPYRNVVPV